MNAQSIAPRIKRDLGSPPHAIFNADPAVCSAAVAIPTSDLEACALGQIEVKHCQNDQPNLHMLASEGREAAQADEGSSKAWTSSCHHQSAECAPPQLHIADVAHGKNATHRPVQKQALGLDTAGSPVSRPDASPVDLTDLPASLCQLLPGRRDKFFTELHSKVQAKRVWRDFSPDEKLVLAMAVVHALGGFAFTLNLSVQRASSYESLLERGEDLYRRQSGYLQRDLKKVLGYVPMFAFVFEYSSAGALHAHGVFLPRCNSAEHLKLVRKAMRKAGGEIHGRKGSSQAHSRQLFDAIGWSGYVTKTRQRTLKLLGANHIGFVNQELKQRTSAAYELFRKHPPTSRSVPAHSLAVTLPGVRMRLLRSVASIRHQPAPANDAVVPAHGMSLQSVCVPAWKASEQHTRPISPNDVNSASVAAQHQSRAAMDQHFPNQIKETNMSISNTVSILPSGSQLIAHIYSGRRAGSAYRYDMTFDGETVVSRARDPEHDLARALLRRGITGLVKIVDGESGAHRMTIDVVRYAGRTVAEGEGRGPHFTAYRPFSRVAVLEGGQSDYEPRLRADNDDDESATAASALLHVA